MLTIVAKEVEGSSRESSSGADLILELSWVHGKRSSVARG